MLPKLASTSETTGLKWAPDMGPNIRMIANSPAPVAAAFSNSSSPTSPGERRCAAIPEPITTAARNADPCSSASKRRTRARLMTSKCPRWDHRRCRWLSAWTRPETLSIDKRDFNRQLYIDVDRYGVSSKLGNRRPTSLWCLRFVAGLELFGLAKSQAGGVAIVARGERLEHIRDVVADRMPFDDRAGEPSAALVEDR